jgi:hypothetical protein
MAQERFSEAQRLKQCLEQLRDVRLVLAGFQLAPQTLKKLRSTIKSLEGAIRHAYGKEARAERLLHTETKAMEESGAKYMEGTRYPKQ